MQKDIHIPEVKDIYIAAVRQFNKVHRSNDWNVYIINDSHKAIETILIVSKGKKGKTETSLLRHKLEILPAKAYAKVEFIEDSVLKLDNEFAVTFFLEGKLYDKKFVFKSGTILESKAEALPVMTEKGILASG